MSHLEDPLLLDYCMGDRLDEQTLAALEEHLFACDACTARAEATAARVGNLRAAMKVLPPPVVSEAQLAELERQRPVQRVNLGAFEKRSDRVRRDVELVVTCVSVDLAGVERLDVRLCSRDGEAFSEVFDAPFAQTDRTVNVACDAHIAGENHAFRVRISGVRDGKPVELADCLVTQDVT